MLYDSFSGTVSTKHFQEEPSKELLTLLLLLILKRHPARGREGNCIHTGIQPSQKHTDRTAPGVRMQTVQGSTNVHRDAATSSLKRDTAQTLLRRLRATPVRLYPPNLLSALNQGPTRPPPQAGSLGPYDVLLVGSDLPTSVYTDASSNWCLGVAAQHALQGGRVVCVYGPAGGSFNLEAFTHLLEGMVMQDNIEDTGEEDAEVQLSRRQSRVLAAMDCVDVIHCEDLNDLYVFCSCYEFAVPSPTMAGAPEESVPLVILEGCGGRDSYISQYERAAGQEVPLSHWLLALLLRRIRCALIITESLPTPSGLQLDYQQPADPLPLETTGRSWDLVGKLVQQSDLLQRLQRPCAHQRAASNNHAAPAGADSHRFLDGTASCIGTSAAAATVLGGGVPPDHELLSTGRFEYLYLETTGHADPLPTVFADDTLEEDADFMGGVNREAGDRTDTGGPKSWLHVETTARLVQLTYHAKQTSVSAMEAGDGTMLASTGSRISKCLAPRAGWVGGVLCAIRLPAYPY